jgi:hypothetical protein
VRAQPTPSLKDPEKGVAHSVRPTSGPVDVKAAHDRISKRFPKILAELAK